MGDEKPKASPGPWAWDVEGLTLIAANGASVIHAPVIEADALLISRAPDLLAMLTELSLGVGEYMQCPICDRMQPNGIAGHAPNCRLAMLLSELT